MTARDPASVRYDLPRTARGTKTPAAPWLLTAGGRAMDLLDPDPDAVALSDVAAQLAKINRFTGATGRFYSVAQHSVLVADQLPERGGGLPPYHLKVAGLLHDAHECWTNDIATPTARALAWYAGGTDVVGMLKAPLDRAVWWAFGLTGRASVCGPLASMELPAEAAALIRAADMIAFATETRDLMPDCPPGRDWGKAPPPAAIPPIRGLAWDHAEARFLDRARTLAALAGLSGGAWER